MHLYNKLGYQVIPNYGQYECMKESICMEKLLGFQFKAIEDKDYDACSKELMEAFNEEPWNEDWSYEDAYTRIDEIMCARVSRGYVIYNGGQAVCMLCGRIMTYMKSKELWIDEFSVNPKYQRRGLGSHMLSLVKKEMVKENIHAMVLNTEREFPSRKFYERNGFGIEENMVLMSRSL